MRLRLIFASISALLIPGTPTLAADYSRENWEHYQGDRSSSHYSTLDQINRDNVGKLAVAWTYRSSNAGFSGTTNLMTNPLVVDGVLFGTSPDAWVFALDAATGEELWRADPLPEGTQFRRIRARGLAYWSDGKERRLLVGDDSDLVAFDASTGSRIPEFGVDGVVDLRLGLDRDPETVSFSLTTPGVVFEDLYIIGGTVSEGYGAAPGHIRAYNIRTGERVWTFHTIPQPGEPGYETWPEDAWERIGGANAWAGLSLDVDRGMVFVPTGSASFDFYGADRHGQNLYANSIVALDARTGRYIWHYQTVHHDLWDKDLPAPPNLVTLTIDGRKVDAVAQVTKTGFLFVLDRETGETVFPIKEVPQQASDVEGEAAWPTQPVPTLPVPFTRQEMTEADITDISPEAHAFVSAQMKKLRMSTAYLPPSTEPTLVFPSFFGGAEWGGAGFDPESGTLFVNANELPCVLTLIKVDMREDLSPYEHGRNIYATACVACHGLDRRGGTHMGAAPSLIGLGERLRETDIEQILRDGRGLMPPFPWVQGGDLAAIKTFLLSEEDPNNGTEPVRENDGRFVYSHTGYNRFEDAEGYPAIKPPWGTLSAIDLNNGQIKWRVPLGEFPELSARGIPPTGTENFGGPVVTAGGLVFIAATADEKIRAFDQETGKILWEGDLPASGFATPATYSVNGQQYLVIACGGGRVRRPSSDAYVAFALPRSSRQ